MSRRLRATNSRLESYPQRLIKCTQVRKLLRRPMRCAYKERRKFAALRATAKEQCTLYLILAFLTR